MIFLERFLPKLKSFTESAAKLVTSAAEVAEAKRNQAPVTLASVGWQYAGRQ